MENFRFIQKKEDDEDNELGLLARITREREVANKKKKKERAEKAREQKDEHTDNLELRSRQKSSEAEKKAQKEQAKKAFFIDSLIEREDSKDQDRAETSTAKQEKASEAEEPIDRLSAQERLQALQEYVRRRQEQLQVLDEANTDPVAVRQRSARRTFLQRVSELVGRRSSDYSEDTEDTVLGQAAGDAIAHVSDDTQVEESTDVTDGSLASAEAERDDATANSVADGPPASRADSLDLYANSTEPLRMNDDDGTERGAATSGPTATGSGGMSTTIPPLYRPHSSSEGSPDTLLQNTQRKERRQSGAPEFLLGAFVGYVFGKRRGRTKAETEQRTIKEKLEKNVQALELKIRRYENTVSQEVARTTAAESSAPSTPSTEVASAAPQEKPPESKRHVATEKTPQPSDISPRFKEVNKLGSNELSQAAAAELGLPVAPIVMERHADDRRSNDSDQAHAAERASSAERTPRRLDRDVYTMTREQVLTHAEAIPYQGTDVRTLFERGSINERILREVVASYHRFGGEAYLHLLRRHINSVEHEPEATAESSARHYEQAESSREDKSRAEKHTSNRGGQQHLTEKDRDEAAGHKASSKDPFHIFAGDAPASQSSSSGPFRSPQVQFLVGVLLGIVVVSLLLLLVL